MRRIAPRIAIAFLLIFCFALQGCTLGDIGDIVDKLPENNMLGDVDDTVDTTEPNNGNKELTAEELYEKVSPSVVEVTGESASMTSTGTGFFCDDEGTVITNYHVIEKCTTATITLSNGKSYTVNKVLGYSESKDIAILSTSCTSSIPLEIRKTAVKTGETVYAIGSSLGLTGSLSNGIISSAEREVEGHTYIQTTAPISSGNSGGPLLDNEGRVVGITTASFVDGQNLNLAIPVAQIDTISTKNPTTLAKMFPQTVEWISERDFFYYEDYDKFVLVFELADEDETTMSSSGTVEIRIVNDDGVTVYEKTRTFTESNFEEWTYNETIEKYLASIYINPNDITPGTSSEGKIYFVVYGDDYYFDESTLNAYDLPTKPIEITVDGLPQSVNYYGYNGKIYTTTHIESVTYEIMYDDSLYIYFAGQKTYDYAGNNATNSCNFGWKLYDSEGYLIDSGTVYISNLTVGDKFRGEIGYAWDCIEPGVSYKIVITDY